jgi:hypothetical protein
VLKALVYLAAPVAYADVVHAALCDRLGASKFVANLPTAAATVAGLLPLLVTWGLPQPEQIKPVLIVSYLFAGAVGLAVPVVLVLSLPVSVRLAVTILHGLLTTALLLTATVYFWEAVLRGTGEAVRGRMFSLSFGIGPLFAVAGSLITQGALDELPYPSSFCLVFLGEAVLMLVAAVAVQFFHLPPDGAIVPRESLGDYLFGGLRAFCSSRILVTVTLAYLLTLIGFMALNNASLEVKVVLGKEPEQLSGWISALRYGTKAAAGAGLGLLLTRRGVRTCSLATVVALITGVLWTLAVPGYFFLLAFGFFGASELSGVYFPYYVATASRPERVKRNSALYALVGYLGYLAAAVHGVVADSYGTMASMGLALAASLLALVALVSLPARPQPAE